MSNDIQEQISRLNQQAAQLYQQGKYEQAAVFAAQAYDFARRHLRGKDPRLAINLNNLAGIYYAMGDYEQAASLWKQALEIRRATLGETHPDFATSLNNLGELYRAIGDYEQAQSFYSQALALTRATLGEAHPDFATCLNNLALLYQARGDYAQAETLYKQALEIWHAALGQTHPDVANGMNNLAGLYFDMGDYLQAEVLYKEALTNTRTIFGEVHPDVARGLNDLATLYYSMGDYEQAALLCKQALEMRRTVLGESHPEVAQSLGNLAMIYAARGDYEQAVPAARAAMDIRRTAFGQTHPNFATSLNNLASLYCDLGDYKQAESFYREALEMRRTILGESHPDFAISLNNLAGLYHDMGNYEQAALLYKQALGIWHTILGESHPVIAIGQSNLAWLYAATACETEAFTLLEQAAAIDNQMIGQIFTISSESQRMGYLSSLQSNFAIFLSLVLQHLSHSTTAVQSALDLVLRRKAIGAEALATQRDAILGGRYPTLAFKLHELTTLRMQIAQATLSGPGLDEYRIYQQHLQEWNARKERLETEIAGQIPEANLAQKLRVVDRQMVAKLLPAGGVLVEFVQVDVCNFQAVPARKEARWKPSRYLAFILAAEEPDSMEMVDLGEVEPIDRMIVSFRESITSDLEYNRDRHLRPEPIESHPIAFDSDGTALRAAIFDPLVKALGDCRRLLLAPDGNLTRLPFEVLPTSDGRCLIDEYHISYLSTGRDVLRFGATSTGQSAPPLVVADPDFDLASERAAPSVEVANSCGRRSRDLDRRSLHFRPLPGTQVEGEQIASVLRGQSLLQRKALEKHLKEYRSPYILHIATHGFFLANQQSNLKVSLLSSKTLSATGGDRLIWVSKLENPLLRSGLALSGANT